MPVLQNYQPDAPPLGYGEDDERCLPFITQCFGETDLVPEVPYGWYAVIRYDSRYHPVSPQEVACWMVFVTMGQRASLEAGERRHMIAREPDGSRVVVLHNDLSEEAERTVEELNARLMATVGHRADWFPQQALLVAAGKTFLRRLWRRLPVSRIAADLWECDHSPSRVMHMNKLDWLDDAEQVFELADMAAPTQREPARSIP